MNQIKEQQKQLDRIEEILTMKQAEPMSLDEACKYLGLSKSYIYKLTCLRQIPFYKPQNGKLFFEKSDLNRWILRNKSKSESEIEAEANDYIAKKGRQAI